MSEIIITRVNTEDELYHYGVPGMRWGHRKSNYEYHQALSNAKSTYKNNKKKIDAEYTKAANMYDKKTKGGKVPDKKAEQAFNKSADKWAADRKSARADYKKAKTEIKNENKHNKSISKAYKKLEKQRVKDLQKQYGSLEDQMTYGKNTNLKKNSQLEKEMKRIENMMKTPSPKEAANKRRGKI